MSPLSLTTDAIQAEILPNNWATIATRFQRRDGKIYRRYEILNLTTLVRYKWESQSLLSHKCALLVVSLPFYFLGYAAFHSIRTFTFTLSSLSSKDFGEGIWKILRSAYYVFGMEVGALYGVFYPLEGRVLFAAFERDLHVGKKAKENDVCWNSESSLTSACLTAMKEKEFQGSCFAAPCMQPIGKLTDPHLLEVEILCLVQEGQNWPSVALPIETLRLRSSSSPLQ